MNNASDEIFRVFDWKLKKNLHQTPILGHPGYSSETPGTEELSQCRMDTI